MLNVNERTANREDVRCPPSRPVPLRTQHTDGRDAPQGRGTLTSSGASKAAGVRAPAGGNAAEWADWHQPELLPARPLGTMKGDAMRTGRELLGILQWVAAFVGIRGGLGSVYEGVCGALRPPKVLGSSFRLYSSTKTR